MGSRIEEEKEDNDILLPRLVIAEVFGHVLITVGFQAESQRLAHRILSQLPNAVEEAHVEAEKFLRDNPTFSSSHRASTMPWLLENNFLRGMKETLDVSVQLFHERIPDIRGLRHVLKQCAKQNKQRKTITSESDAFAELKGVKLRAVILSSCHTGQNDELARKIIENSGVKAIVGYPETAYDHFCAIAEQLLYFQLLRKTSVKVWEGVRRVNDALVVLGVEESRLLVCRSKENGSIEGPCPWWTTPNVKDRASRSFISSIRELVPRRGKISSDDPRICGASSRSLEFKNRLSRSEGYIDYRLGRLWPKYPRVPCALPNSHCHLHL